VATVLESLNDDDWFAHQPVGDDTAHGAVTVTVEPGRVYTFTTQGDALKGNTVSPESASLAYFAQGYNGATTKCPRTCCSRVVAQPPSLDESRMSTTRRSRPA
jgi:hypothetical protein